jgi:hypothetical protein
MKTPPISRAALEGLTRALAYMEADDLTDDTDQECKEKEAADKWIRKVWAANPSTTEKARP